MESAQIRSYFWSEYRKTRTRNNSVFGHFSRSVKSSRTAENLDVSSAKNLRLQSNPLSKSFIYTNKNKEPKIDPCGPTVLMGEHLED